MRKKMAFVGAVVAALSLVPLGPASACPDPENPCDLEPQPMPAVWCKVSPWC